LCRFTSEQRMNLGDILVCVQWPDTLSFLLALPAYLYCARALLREEEMDENRCLYRYPRLAGTENTAQYPEIGGSNLARDVKMNALWWDPRK